MKKGKKSFIKIVSVVVAALMLVCLMPVTGFAASGASFRVKNNNGPGGDHGYIQATYNGSSVTIENNETHTFTYAQGKNSVRIDFIADSGYQFDYYVIGNGSMHLHDNPSYFDARDYIYESGSNNTINLNPKWEHANSYTIDTAVSTGGTITPDQTVNSGSDCTVSYSANTGYHLLSVNADGIDVTHSNPGSYTFRNITSDHSISVVFEADIYNITYNLNGGAVSEPNPATYTVATPAFDLNNPEKPGYEFAGWTGTGLSGNTITVTVPAGQGGDREYTANWNTIDYTVTFSEGDHGSTDDTKTFTGLHYGDPFPAAPEIAPEAGWTFDGWPVMPETVTGDATYTATYTQEGYTVTFDIGSNGTTTDPASFSGLRYGDAFPSAPEVTPNSGWAFDYWTPALPSSVESSATYYAHYTQLGYMVTWNNWDNTQLEQDTNTAYGTIPSYDGAVPTEPSTAQYDYVFSGWSPAVTVVTGDVIYTAQFTPVPRSYTVTWNNWDNTQLEQDTNIAYGTMPSYDGAVPTEPSTAQYDYLFNGWSPAVTVVTGDVTYTAQFTTVPRSYTVTWNNWDGALLEQDINIYYGNMPSYDGAVPAEPSTAQYDYIFSGWLPAMDAVTGDVTYTAQFTPVLRSYTVTFEDYNGAVLKTGMVIYGGGAIAPSNPNNKIGYHFTGWDKGFSNINGPLTVKAQYAINSYRVRFFRADGVSQIGKSKIVNWGSGANVETAPKINGYSFGKWKLNGDDPSVTTSLTDVKENIDAIAVYNAELYPVTFVDFNGKELGADNVPYGGDATPPSVPLREGYKFTGWSRSCDNVTDSITCVAQYAINTYTVTFADYNGDVIKTQTVEWNTGASAPADPARDGYTFTGWDVPFNNITKDTAVTAMYEAIEAPSPTPAATPSPMPTASVSPEPVPQTGGGAGWLWWLLLILVIGVLWLIFAAKLSVIPIAEALSDNGDGTYTVRWGYENKKNRKYKAAENKSVISLIKGKSMKNSANPPVEFEKGRVENVFTTTVDKDAIVQWRINNRKARVDIKEHR